MAQELNIEQKLNDLLVSRDFHPELTGKDGRPSNADEAKTFTFDYVSSSGKNYGTMVIVLANDNEMKVMYGDNLGKTMEGNDKQEFFDFIQALHQFAVRNFWTYSSEDLSKLKYVQAGMAAIKEGLFEGYYGNRRVSYTGEPTEARMMIRHNRALGENDARFRYVESIYIETADQERFRLPFTNMTGAKAMLEHVRQGGKPYDVRGNHICEMVAELKVLNRFNRASAGRVMEGTTQAIVEQAQAYYQSLRESLKRMTTTRGYSAYFEAWHPAEIGEHESLVEDIKNMFVQQTLDTRIEAALPLLARIQQQGNAVKEADIFESWINRLTEGTWNLPETPEQVAKLQQLMSQELIVGPDATNATEQLYDLVGDDQLFDRLSSLAERDPRANAWNDTDVMERLRELGIETPQQAPAGAEQMPAEVPTQLPAATVAPAVPPVAEDAVDDFLARGGQIQQGKFHKPRKSEKTDYGSRHIGGVRDAVAGKAGKTLGRAAATNFMGGGKAVVGEADNLATFEAGCDMDESMGGTVAGAIAPLEEGSSDYVGNAIEDLRVSMPGLDRETFLDELYTYLDARYGKRVADMTMDHGNDAEYDEYYASYSDLAEGDPGYDKHSFLGKIRRGIEADNKGWGQLGNLFAADNEKDAEKALRKGNRYYNMTRGNNKTPGGFPKTTVEEQGVAEGGCNATMEGEMCPEHGLAECGTYESVAESRDSDALLARIKSLALIK